MFRYTKPRFKLYRREKIDLFLINRYSKKNITNFENFRRFDDCCSHFSYQLKEKRKLKIIYGVLNKQFKYYYYLSKKIGGNLSENMIHLLESRLDNTVYRMGFASTRSEAKQIISHRYISVNNSIVNIPSYLIKVGDIVKVRDKFCNYHRVINSLKLCKINNYNPSWIFINFDKFSGFLKRFPTLKETGINVDKNLVLSFFLNKC